MRIERLDDVPGAWAYRLVPTTERERDLLRGRDRFAVWLPDEVRVSRPHPDLEALALVLVCRPFVERDLAFPAPVSSTFAHALAHRCGFEVTTVDDVLEVREPPDDGVPGLAFSGGVDSIAALTVLPPDTHAYFLARRVPEGAPKHHLDPAAGRAASEGIAALGRAVRVVDSDLEYVRERAGYPEHYANGVPLVLAADHDRLRSVSWGTVAESAFDFGRTRFVPYLDRPYNRRWTDLFAAAGLPILNPVMGVTEVGTSRITLGSPYGHLAQSCVRGPLGAPCMACIKCFRKRLLDAGHTGTWPDDRELDELLSHYSVRQYLATTPLKHPLGLAWWVARYPGRHPVLRLLAQRLEVDGDDDLSFAERWYRPVIDHWPAEAAGPVAAALDERLERMSDEEAQRLEAWDVTERERGEYGQGFAAALGAVLDVQAARVKGEPVKPVGPRPAAETVAGLEAEVDALRRRLNDLETSTSYRLGHRLARLARPVTGARRRR